MAAPRLIRPGWIEAVRKELAPLAALGLLALALSLACLCHGGVGIQSGLRQRQRCRRLSKSLRG